MEEPVSEKMSYNNNITIPKIGNINTSINLSSTFIFFELIGKFNLFEVVIYLTNVL